MKMIGWGIGLFILGGSGYLYSATPLVLVKSEFLRVFLGVSNDNILPEVFRWTYINCSSILLITLGAVLLLGGIIQKAVSNK